MQRGNNKSRKEKEVSRMQFGNDKSAFQNYHLKATTTTTYANAMSTVIA